MSNFKVGEKVVCINNSPRQLGLVDFGFVYPIINNIYTIRDVQDNAIFLEEIINPNVTTLKGFREVGFASHRFRKLDHQFAEDICAELVKQVKEEQLILS